MATSDPFDELDRIVHAQFGTVFTVARTGDTVLVCIDEQAMQDSYSGNRVSEVEIIGEILPGDFGKLARGDTIQNAEGDRFKVVEVMPTIDGSRDIYLRRL